MARINENYLKLQTRYLFSEIGKKTREFIESHPDANVIKLGIGDTTLPLSPEVIKAFHEGVDEMAISSSYKGYGPEQGYLFLRELIARQDFQARGVDISPDEIFISDGSKCDTGNILDIFGSNKIAISDPSYPVYVDTNVMVGNTGKGLENGQYEGLEYLPCTEKTDFLPNLPQTKVDLIYLCSPNNPTGTVMKRVDLEKWVAYALENKAIILFDAAYERFISEETVPHSIYEIKEAQKCAIEFRSFSKTAGFTGIRCAFTVIPKKVMGYDESGSPQAIHPLWNRRHCTKFNGVSYPVQKAAAAIYSQKGAEEITLTIKKYMDNATIIREGLQNSGFTVYGGINSPYVWLKTLNNMTSWDFFDVLLNELHIIGTPGSGFGPSGEGYFRLTGFASLRNTKEAVKRIMEYSWNK